MLLITKLIKVKITKVKITLILQNGIEETERRSKRNRREAAKVVEIIQKLIEAGEVSVKDIGVITPYKAQVVIAYTLNLKLLFIPRGGGGGEGFKYSRAICVLVLLRNNSSIKLFFR